MTPWQGAQWVTAPDGRQVLHITTRRVSGGLLAYGYSVAPGVAVTLVTVPGPGMLPATDPLCAALALDLAPRGP